MAQEKKKVGGFANTQKKATPSAASEVLNAEETLAKLDAAEAKVGQVKVIHGSADGVFDNLVGVSVATVRASLVTAFNIPGDATAFINGEQVDGNYVLQANEVLEFVKSAGQKG